LPTEQQAPKSLNSKAIDEQVAALADGEKITKRIFVLELSGSHEDVKKAYAPLFKAASEMKDGHPGVRVRHVSVEEGGTQFSPASFWDQAHAMLDEWFEHARREFPWFKHTPSHRLAGTKR
jgi:hypothetical protein